MHGHLTLGLVATLSLLCPATESRAADAPVSLELLTEPGFPVAGQQRWLSFLKEFAFVHIRIRSARGIEEPEIDQQGTDDAPRYRVRGVLTSGGTLHLPGAAIRYGQRREMKDWLEKLRRGGREAATSPTGVFGLTAKQLLAVHDALAAPVTIATKDRSARDVVEHITQALRMDVRVDSRARALLQRNEKVQDELRGVSRGTALVATLRPFGLAVIPTASQQGNTGLRITPPGSAKDTWPLGWKPKKSPNQLAPNLFKFLPVEIDDTPLVEALEALRQRVEIPILLDHNALAERAVDPTAKVSLPRTKTFYKKIIDRLLFQLKLKSDLRVDEAGHPFLWVTTIGR